MINLHKITSREKENKTNDCSSHALKVIQIKINLISLLPYLSSHPLIGFYFAPFICRALSLFLAIYNIIQDTFNFDNGKSIDFEQHKMWSTQQQQAEQQQQQQQQQRENINMMIYAFICSIERPTPGGESVEKLSINECALVLSPHLSTSDSVELCIQTFNHLVI